MTLPLPGLVKDPGVQQALDVIARQFPLTAAALANGSVGPGAIAPETLTGDLLVRGTITGDRVAAGTITGNLIAAGTIEAGNIKAATITANEIAAGTITARQIAASTITGTLVAAGTIEARNIKAGTVTATEIAAGTITANEIAAHTITANEIASGTITSGEIASGSILGGDIAAGEITASHITISSLSALAADLGTITAGTVTGATLQTAARGKRVVIDSSGLNAYDGSGTAVLNFDTSTGNLKITGAIQAGSTIPATTITGTLTDSQIADLAAAKLTGQIVTTQITDSAITTAKLNAGAVTAAKIAADTITASEIAANAITATELAADAVTTTKLAADSVTSAKIAANTIVAGDIAAATITTREIAASTITGSNIAASTIAASNLTVSRLSAIAADLGTITAGTITGATFQTSSSNPKVIMDSRGFRALDSGGTAVINIPSDGSEAEFSGVIHATGFEMEEGSSEGSAPNSVLWTDDDGDEVSRISTYGEDVTRLTALSISANHANHRAGGTLHLGASSPSGLALLSVGSSAFDRSIFANADSANVTILNNSGASGFLQLTRAAKYKINFGSSTVTYPGGTNQSNTTSVSHGLGTTPMAVVATANDAGRGMGVRNFGSTTFDANAQTLQGDLPARGASVTFYWVAIG